MKINTETKIELQQSNELARSVECGTLTEYGRELEDSAVPLRPVSESSGGSLPQSLLLRPDHPPLDILFPLKRCDVVDYTLPRRIRDGYRLISLGSRLRRIISRLLSHRNGIFLNRQTRCVFSERRNKITSSAAQTTGARFGNCPRGGCSRECAVSKE
ncbi:hypothetical protein EVAR_18228_1 [Eumeta japonica]|uniref:Uncharacterized protein n=1 Tax=Eumeta variegata TaxID=151549 RepID=A0A4C1UJD7_EUMVA|nr:hypothetical protein EVAR_18228_1 [Eumeta japonica]